MTAHNIDENRRAKFAEALAKESGLPEVFLWLSFCDPDRPKGQQFLGVIITRAHGPAHAISKLWELGINPGGEVASFEFPGLDVPLEHLDKLLSIDDLKMAGYV